MRCFECALDQPERAGCGAHGQGELSRQLSRLVEYAIAFANDWADDLAIKTSTTVPADAWLPAAIAPTLLANLTGLTVTALNGSSVTINTGVTPPAAAGLRFGGGISPSCRARIRPGGARDGAQHDLFSRDRQRPVLYQDV
jgi:hypothetical protein